MTHECNKEREIDLIHDDIKEIKQDVKEMLKFKWQILGGAGIIGAVISYIAGLFIK